MFPQKNDDIPEEGKLDDSLKKSHTDAAEKICNDLMISVQEHEKKRKDKKYAPRMRKECITTDVYLVIMKALQDLRRAIDNDTKAFRPAKLKSEYILWSYKEDTTYGMDAYEAMIKDLLENELKVMSGYLDLRISSAANNKKIELFYMPKGVKKTEN